MRASRTAMRENPKVIYGEWESFSPCFDLLKLVVKCELSESEN